MTKQNPLKSVNQSFTIMNLQVGLRKNGIE